MSAVPQTDQSILLREDRDGICTLTMNRPQQMNLLTGEMLEALQEAFDAIAQDARVRGVVLAGAGKGFCAERALEWGRVNRVVPPEQLDAAVDELARKLAAKPAGTVAAGKRAFYQQMDMGLAKAYDLASGAISRWLEREVRGKVRDLEHRDEYPERMVEQMKALGLFGATIPQEHGGLGLPASTYAKIGARNSEVWMSLTGIFNSHPSRAAGGAPYGPEAKRGPFLPKFASG